MVKRLRRDLEDAGAKPPRQRDRRVRRPRVDDDNFRLDIGLRGNDFQGQRKLLPGILGGNHDSNSRDRVEKSNAPSQARVVRTSIACSRVPWRRAKLSSSERKRPAMGIRAGNGHEPPTPRGMKRQPVTQFMSRTGLFSKQERRLGGLTSAPMASPTFFLTARRSPQPQPHPPSPP